MTNPLAKQKEPTTVPVNDISTLATGELVTVNVKAKIVDAPEKVQSKEGEDLMKQECVIGDESGCFVAR